MAFGPSFIGTQPNSFVDTLAFRAESSDRDVSIMAHKAENNLLSAHSQKKFTSP